MADYDSFKQYFYSRRRWIFSLMGIPFVADFLDTVIKGKAYLLALGPMYYIRIAPYLALCLLALKIKDERFHAASRSTPSLSKLR